MNLVNQSRELPIVKRAAACSEPETSSCPQLRTKSHPLSREAFAAHEAALLARHSRPFQRDDGR